MEDLSGHRLGEYTLLEKIGDGGNGDVYRAEHRILRKLACVKVMNGKRRADEEGAQRFLREAQLASKLRHDNAAHVYDFGIESEGELMWIAMELVEGVSLDKWLLAHGRMPLVDAVPFLEDVFDVVGTAHANGIVHRDLKPANVMLVLNTNPNSPGKYKAKLIDFGIAKGLPGSLVEEYVPEPFADKPGDRAATDRFGEALDPRRESTERRPALLPIPVVPHERQLTPNGSVFGTLAYMSPEQTRNSAKVGPSADIYSLGVMIFETLTAQRPATDAAPSSSSRTRRHRRVTPCLGVSREIARVLERALDKEPEQRHASVRDLATDLRRAAQADPAEQLRSLARQWETSDRSPAYLARGKTLMELRRISPGSGGIGKREETFLALSLQRARRSRWAVGALISLVVMSILLVRAETRSRDAEQFTTQSQIERGQQALLDGKYSEAVRNLEQARQRGDRSPGVAFMLARALQPRMAELASFTSHSGRMWSAAFAPDGKRVLTADDKGARMWDAASSQLLFTMNHGDIVYAATFSPDGSRIVTAGADGTVRIWNAATGAPIRELRGHGAAERNLKYYALAMSSAFVAAIDLSGRTVHVWDVEAGAQVAELNNDALDIKLLAFSADGHWLATSGGGAVRVFETSSWRLGTTIGGVNARSLRFDPTKPCLAIGSDDGKAALWEVPSGIQRRSLRVAGASVDAVAFSGDGAFVATGSRDGIEQVWDTGSGGLRAQRKSHLDRIYAVEFSRTGELLLSSGADGVVAIIDVTTGMPVTSLEGPEEPKGRVLVAHFDPESRRVVGAAFEEGAARVWDAAVPYRRWYSPPIGAECDTVESLVPDQRFVALSCRNHGTRIFDTVRGELLAELPSVSTAAGSLFPVLPALTNNGDRVAIARGNTVEVYALPSGQLLQNIVHQAAVNAVAFAQTGHVVVSGSLDGSLLLTEGENAPVSLPSSQAAITALTLLADGRVVAADEGHRLRVIGSDHKTLLLDAAAPSSMRLLRPSPDGRRLITLSNWYDQVSPTLWALDEGRLVARLDGHEGRVFTARFIDGGSKVLTSGSDGSVGLWDGVTGTHLRSFRGDSHSLADTSIAPDGSVVIAGGSDGFVRFWDVSSGRLLWMLQAHDALVTGVHYEGSELVTRGRDGSFARWTLPSAATVIEACHARHCASAANRRKIARLGTGAVP